MKNIKTKSVQLDPTVLDNLQKLKKETNSHSLTQLICLLINSYQGKQPLEKRVEELEKILKNKEGK